MTHEIGSASRDAPSPVAEAHLDSPSHFELFDCQITMGRFQTLAAIESYGVRAYSVQRTALFTPAAVPSVRCTRRISFRRNARWGYAGVTGTPRVATRPDRSGHSALAGRTPRICNYRKRRRPPCGGPRPCRPGTNVRRKFLARKGTSPT